MSGQEIKGKKLQTGLMLERRAGWPRDWLQPQNQNQTLRLHLHKPKSALWLRWEGNIFHFFEVYVVVGVGVSWVLSIEIF